MGIATGTAAFHLPLSRKPSVTTNEMAEVAITKYGALSFPEKWQKIMEPKKIEFVRIAITFTHLFLTKENDLARSLSSFGPN
jgi:hypothetical protein